MSAKERRYKRMREGTTNAIIAIIFYGFLLGGPVMVGYWLNGEDDPLFSKDQNHCGFFAPNVSGLLNGKGTINITAGGLRRGCIEGYDAWVVHNRLPDRAATLCVGRRGHCIDGHSSPFPGNRLTLGPGRSADVVFRYGRGRFGFADVERYYPVTLMPIPGRPSANLDLVVHIVISNSGGA